MNERLKELVKKIEENEELKEKIQELAKQEVSTTEYITICKEYGIEIEESDLEVTKKLSNEISDDELEAVAGGTVFTSLNTGDFYVHCLCCLGGGGESITLDGVNYPACACVAAGGGVETLPRLVTFGNVCSHVGEPCWCVLAGAGDR